MNNNSNSKDNKKRNIANNAGIGDGSSKSNAVNDKNPRRIYVCHTLYHVYVSILKELNFQMAEARDKVQSVEQTTCDNRDEAGTGRILRADIALSTVYMDLSEVGEKLKTSGIFENVYSMEEHYAEDFPEIIKYRQNHGNILIHTWNRLKYTKKLGKKQEEFIKIDFRKYQDIYVFCDSDPIGYYLNYKHIYYHAVEDGYNCLKVFDAAHVDNAGHFEFKAKLARMGLIFIQNGYSKYCLDMEVNDKSVFDYEFDKYIEVPRAKLEKQLGAAERKKILDIFLPDAEEISRQLSGCDDCILFLTEGYPGDRPDIREKICEDILRDYCQGKKVVIKPHPRDDVDYATKFGQCIVIRGKFPIEVLNFIDGIHFSLALSIITSALDNINFVDEKRNLGPAFYDAYEPAEKHAFMIKNK
ncbi:MAG: lipooligosaccharide sialyltransferase [Lachnospiraceae bacterium]|nr:lipooligosaccharide sialyltransferase [Candidatus Merdinaster equi]